MRLPITKAKRRLRVLLTSVVLILSSASVAQADTFTDWGYINLISAGWIENSVAVFHSAPPKNEGCQVTADKGGYATNPNDAGANLFHATLLAAFMNGKQVQLLIRGCVYGKPHIIGVSVR